MPYKLLNQQIINMKIYYRFIYIYIPTDKISILN